MNPTSKQLLLTTLRGALVLSLLFGACAASADTLTIDSSQSTLHFGFQLVSLSDGSVIGTFVGQGDVPQGSMPLGNGMRTPGFSNGLDVQVAGTINVTPAGFSITGGSNVHLLDSGSWQPGLVGGTGFLPGPAPGELGGYLEASLSQNGVIDTFIAARTNNDLLDFATPGPLTLGPGGVFNDPNGVVTLESGQISISAITPLSGLYNSESNIVSSPTPGVFGMSGSYLHGKLTLNASGSLLLNETVLFDGLPVGVLVTASGTIVTQTVPEPGSVALLAAGSLLLPIAFARRGRGKNGG